MIFREIVGADACYYKSYTEFSCKTLGKTLKTNRNQIQHLGQAFPIPANSDNQSRHAGVQKL